MSEHFLLWQTTMLNTMKSKEKKIPVKKKKKSKLSAEKNEYFCLIWKYVLYIDVKPQIIKGRLEQIETSESKERLRECDFRPGTTRWNIQSKMSKINLDTLRQSSFVNNSYKVSANYFMYKKLDLKFT